MLGKRKKDQDQFRYLELCKILLDYLLDFYLPSLLTSPLLSKLNSEASMTDVNDQFFKMHQLILRVLNIINILAYDLSVLICSLRVFC